MGKELILEIGTEEMPAAFLPPAMRDMERLMAKELDETGISHGAIRTMATPRRLFLSVADVAEKQEERVVEKLGPAVRVAFDAQGNPLPAALGFARSQGLAVDDLETLSTEKGEYLAARKRIAGEETIGLLKQALPRFISSIPFRKSMRWSDGDFSFARPIHWIMALFGGELIPFAIEKIASGKSSRGHRFLAPGMFEADNLDGYLQCAKEHAVIADPEERKRIILKQAGEAASLLSGRPLYDEELLQTVSCLVEYPFVIAGSFDAAYLALPREVLVTTMMSHQKYFPVVDGEGKLLPHFLTVSNTPARDPAVLKKGNEKVIRARLADAEFFFAADRKVRLEERLESLKEVVFHTLLGTSHEKVLRFRALAVEIAGLIDEKLEERVYRTATLAKADLSTQMVGEFPDLQGVMGREYALLEGEEPRVARGIYEHYLPVAAGGQLPETDEGALVSIADKMDSITGFFGVNLLPTGAADPYALRRQALGVINILLAKGYPLKIDYLIDRSLALLGERLKRPPEEIKAEVLEFFRLRYENQLVAQGHAHDLVNAVLATGMTDVSKSMRKIEAMEEFRRDAAFEPLAVAFKRVGNIIKGFGGGAVNPSLFGEEAERNLYQAYLEASRKVVSALDGGDYLSALRAMAGLREPVDLFFDAVLVMAKEEAVKFNRLSLLGEISLLFRHVADFSLLSGSEA